MRRTHGLVGDVNRLAQSMALTLLGGMVIKAGAL